MFNLDPDVAPKFGLLHRIMMSDPMQAVGAGLRGYGGAASGQPVPQGQQQPIPTQPVQGPMPGPPKQMSLLERILQGGAAGLQGYGASMGARVK